jgi:hypothetical protein
MDRRDDLQGDERQREERAQQRRRVVARSWSASFSMTLRIPGACVPFPRMIGSLRCGSDSMDRLSVLAKCHLGGRASINL